MHKPVMVCIGKVGLDTFLQGEVFKPKRQDGIWYEQIKLGAKFYVEEATFSPGGNIGNAATTFARQGCQTSLVTVLGNDPAGQTLLQAYDKEHITTSQIIIDDKAKTSFSTILLAPTGERTILDYPGTAKLERENIKAEHLEGDWLYVSSLGSMPLLKSIMKRAKQAGMRIAFNPASFELKHLQDCANLLPLVDLFAVNKEEAELFVDGTTTTELATNLAEAVEYVLVSDGPRGSVATDGQELVKAGMYEDVPVLDRTGAGDAFTSGFVVQIAAGKSLPSAITFASANSTSVVSKIGSAAGILRASARLHDMPLKTSKIK